MSYRAPPVCLARDLLEGCTPNLEILVELVDGLGLGVRDLCAAVRAAHVQSGPTADRWPEASRSRKPGAVRASRRVDLRRRADDGHGEP